jgi:Uma2 family endonuclease
MISTLIRARDMFLSMNAPVRSFVDLPRRTFTVEDVERMIASGIMQEDERVELIFGELIPMNAKGIRHEVMKMTLNLRWARLCPPDIQFIPETTFRLSRDTFLEPDFLVFPKSSGLRGLNGSTALLAVEIADSSLPFDLGAKAQVYAHFGVRELWVIDIARERIHVHHTPEDDRYINIAAFGADNLVTPRYAPAEFALRPSELDTGET